MSTPAAEHTPIEIRLHQASRLLELSYSDGSHFELPCELLRVYSPSAEVQGHSPAQAVLQTGKELVNILAIEPIGHYAVKLVFDDGHDSGLYTWSYLYDLGKNRGEYWTRYMEALQRAGIRRRISE